MNPLPSILRIFHILVSRKCMIIWGYDSHKWTLAVSAVLYYGIRLIRIKWWHSEKSCHDAGIQVNVLNITHFPLTFKYTSFDLFNVQISMWINEIMKYIYLSVSVSSTKLFERLINTQNSIWIQNHIDHVHIA